MKEPAQLAAPAVPGLIIADALLRLMIRSFDLEVSASRRRCARSLSSSCVSLGSTRTS